MIDLERVRELCKQIEEGQVCGGISPGTRAAIAEIERLIGAPVFQYTSPLRCLLEKNRVRDFDQHRCDILGQTHRIRGIASMCNQGEVERIAREKEFKVEVPEPMFWPEKGDLVLTASLHVKERYSKHIRCVVSDAEIDSIPLSSKSLSKRNARMRRLGGWMRLYCDGFKYYIEGRWKMGEDFSLIDEINYREVRR